MVYTNLKNSFGGNMERVLKKDNGLNFENLKKTITRLGTEFSKGILVPVFTLPIVGMLLAVGVLLTNPSIPMSKIGWINNFGILTKDSLLSIFINLSPVFAVGIASGMAKRKKGDAGLSGIILFFIFLYAMNSFMKINNLLITGDLRGSGQSLILGVQVLDMGVFLGIILGLVTSYLHNKFVEKEFDGAMRLYGSSNLALLIGIPVVIMLSIFFTYTWPIIQVFIAKMTNTIVSTGVFGVGIYGFLERVLIPTGLHHLLWVPVELSSISGTGVVDGQYLEGVRNIAMAELSSSTVDRLGPGAVYLTKAMSKMFGLVGAALAMYKCSNSDLKEKTKGILIPAVGAAVLAGVTEPLEFSFLFTAPLLFIVHAILAGLGMAVAALLDLRVIAVSGGIEFLAMMLPAGSKGDTFKFILLGLVQIGLYFGIFTLLIKKFNLKTPGREGEDVKLYTKQNYKEKQSETSIKTNSDKAKNIVLGLGGSENIKSVTNCYSRLRVQVANLNSIDKSILNTTGCSGIVKNSEGVQIIYGLSVQKIKKEVCKELNIKDEE